VRWRWLVLLVAMTSLASAQPRDRRGDTTQDRREAVKKRIRVMRAATLTDELNLDEKVLSKLLPVLAKWDDVTEDLLRKRVELQRRLEAADPKDHKAIDKLIDEAVANQKGFWELEEKRLAELRKILTPPQISKLLVVLPAFERKIQNQLRRAMARAGRGADRGGRDDDDLDLDADDVPAPRRR
jgi:Spy/CpxP family protein refolding chaperone